MITSISDKEIRTISLKLVRWIQEKISFMPRSPGKNIIEYKISSNVFFKMLKDSEPNFDEVEWVKILHFLKSTERLKVFYHVLLDIPPQFDGKSCIFYPEAYDGEGKMKVKVRQKISNPSIFYPECPGIEERSWNVGKIIYLPEEIGKVYEELKYVEISKAP